MKIHFVFLSIVFLLMKLFEKSRKNIIVGTINRVDDNINEKITSKLILMGVFLLMTIFIGMRSINIGTDTSTYISLHWIKNYNFSNIEIALPLISYLTSMITTKYFLYLLILQSLILLGVFVTVRRYIFPTEYFMFLYITSFTYLYSTSAIRFLIAFSIILCSFESMVKKEDMKVFMYVFIAMLFHTSAVIFIPAYMFTKPKIRSKKTILRTIIILIIIIVLNIIDLKYLLDFFSLSKYTYIVNDLNPIGGLSVPINIGIFVFAAYYKPLINIYKEEYNFFIKMHFISVFLDLFMYSYRLVWYFRFPIWFLLPIVLLNLKESNRKLDYLVIYVSMVLIYSLYYFMLLKNSYPTHNLLKYQFNSNFN